MGYKDVRVLYVPPISKDQSGIGVDLPAHVKLEWFDSEGRRNRQLLTLPDELVARIAAYPDKE